jgi:RecA-family ATPase
MAATDARKVPVQLKPENIPASLRAERRWVAWLPKWADGKFGKKPGRIDRPGIGLTNWANEGWVDFDTAVAAWRANPSIFGGVGYVMTGSSCVTGVDLDGCIDAAGNIAPWAAEIVQGLNTYTEVSPSGTGIRAFVEGHLEDWQTPRDGEVKIEVYGGSAGRFLTVTGAHLASSPAEVRPAQSSVLADMRARYKMAPKAKAEVEDLHLPDIIPECLLRDVSELNLPAHARNFLSDGPTSTDRSSQLFATALALIQAGESREQVYSRLANNEHALSLAEDHWKGHAEKALRYLWKHSAQKGEERAKQIGQQRFDEFDDLEPAAARAEQAARSAPQAVDSADDFDDLDASEQRQVAADNRHVDLAPVKRHRFDVETVDQFLQHTPPKWIVKNVLPRAGLAVIYGASSSGKTFFTLDLVSAVARGQDWRGAKVNKGRVLYVVAEGAGGFRNRLQAYCDFHGVDPGQFEISLLRQAPNLLTKDDIREFLEKVVPLGGFDIIVIDTYARAMAGGNENDAKDVGQAVAHCDVIHRKTGAMVVLVHHSGKDATKGARGSGALRAAADLEIEVVQTREYRAATVTKQKDGADGAEYQFKLAEVAIGEDEDGETITSCVVEHKEGLARPSVLGRTLNPLQRMVMDTLRSLLDLSDAPTYSEDLRTAVLARVPRNPDSKRDNRPRDIKTAIGALIEGGEIIEGEKSALELANNDG